MKLIVITSPQFIGGEASYITSMLQKGIDLVHLRKPESSPCDCAKLLDAIPEELHRRIVIHYHHCLCKDYHLGGMHISPYHMSHTPHRCNGTISRSCHSIDEIVSFKSSYDYLFLSPIFNSISKQGYHGAFSASQLQEAQQKGIIDNKVIALGGITANNLSVVKQLGFGGAALLGDVWQQAGTKKLDNYLNQLIYQIK
jgi:thiamine-phosphate pyrophosphorylase